MQTSQVPADEVVEVKHEPKIDFTYSGQQKLDLGFGASGGSPAQPVQALSWERLRQVYSQHSATSKNAPQCSTQAVLTLGGWNAKC
jgi:hypothetical protein